MRCTRTKAHSLAAILVALLTILMVVSSVLNVSINANAAFTPRKTAPATDNKYYYSKINPFYPNYGMPNCTCYAYGRAYEILGVDPKLPTGNAGTWYTSDKTHKKGSTPQLGAIACWKGSGTGSKNGHVAVVEEINGSKITISESNYDVKYGAFNYKTITPSTYGSWLTFQGYIYIGDAPDSIVCENIQADTYYLKNASTGTYLTVDGAKATKGQNLSVAAKQTTAAFQFKASGGTENYLYSAINNSYVVNPYSDSPGVGTNVTLYTKDNSGTQLWGFEKVSGGYLIRSTCASNCALAVNGTNVQLASANASDKKQIWTLEGNTVSVKAVFHRNLDADDTNTVTETFTTGVSNQKFGYNTDGTGRYKTMNDPSVGFGQWEKPGYKMLGWSTEQNATEKMWNTYAAVIDSWITARSPSIDLYAVWELNSTTEGDVNADGNVDTLDVVVLQKWILKAKDASLNNADAADLNHDGIVDVFDLALLKRAVLRK